MGVETIKRQTRAAYGCLVVGLLAQAKPMAYRLYTRSVCDTQSATIAAVCGWWHYISVICLYLCYMPNENGLSKISQRTFLAAGGL